MEIATGYFAKAQSYADDGYVLVSIAKKKPWFLVAMEVFDLLKADVVIVRLLDIHP